MNVISLLSFITTLTQMFLIIFDASFTAIMIASFANGFICSGSNAVDIDFATELTYPILPNYPTYFLNAGNRVLSIVLTAAISMSMD